MAVIRPARSSDAPSIADIYNAGIAEGGATFETAPRTADDIIRRIDDQARYPLIVAENEAREVVGWAGASSYRARPCYAGVGEFSVHDAELLTTAPLLSKLISVPSVTYFRVVF